MKFKIGDRVIHKTHFYDEYQPDLEDLSRFVRFDLKDRKGKIVKIARGTDDNREWVVVDFEVPEFAFGIYRRWLTMIDATKYLEII